MIASVSFRNFKALRATSLALTPCNLVLGPSGSGKTSLIEAVLRLRALAGIAGEAGGKAPAVTASVRTSGPEIAFRFDPPHETITVRLNCVSEFACDHLEVEPPGDPGWPALRAQIARICSFRLDPEAMAGNPVAGEAADLQADGGNLAAVLHIRRERDAEAFAGLQDELRRILPEFAAIETRRNQDGRVKLALRLAESGERVEASDLAQGALYMLAYLTLAMDPDPPSVVCIEEVDRGSHPRILREVRDVMYRLSYPDSFGMSRKSVQVIATTHSPFLLDLFRDHPEEVVISHKHGQAARFERLSDRPDLHELLQEGSLGDMWISGILGGVPGE